MNRKPLPTPDELRALLRYDENSGDLFWRTRRPEMFSDENGRRNNACAIWNSRYAGKPAATTTRLGYLRLSVNGKPVMAHRVAWAIKYGKWPAGDIDHINGDRTDNRIENLRVVTTQDNNKNLALRKSNSTGIHGVTMFRKKWRAQIGHNGRQIHLGCFDTVEKAALARKAAEHELGYHKNHGRKSAKTTL